MLRRLGSDFGLVVAFLALGVAGLAVFKSLQKEDAKEAVPIQTSAERRQIGADREIRRMNRTVAAYRRDLGLAKNKDDKQEAYTKLAYELSWLGRVETEAGRFDHALKHLDEALRTSVNCGELAKHEALRALILRGRCYLQSARYPEADRDFLEALSCAKSEFGEETKQWQDVTMQRMVLKAHRRQFQDIDADLAVLRQSWERNRDTNPKTATGRYQSITMGGPARIDLLLETMTVLFQTSCSSNADIAARLRSLLAMIKTIHICDRVSERKWLLLILEDLQKIPRTDPAVAKLITEFESLPEARSL